MKAYERALAEKQYIVDLRRHFHSHPELSWQEYATTERICEELDKLSIPYNRLPKTGVIATLKGTKKHPVIGLRADIDALPVKEVKDLPFKSLNEGVMHACGHDSHMSMLLGAAKILSEHKEEVNCTVRFIFQPAEETIQGAKTLLNNTEVMECDNLFAIHIFPYIETGGISVEEGPRFTSADTIKFKIMGRGGHGSMPQDTVDPIVTSAAVINNLQAIVSREIDPRDTCVISVCSIHSGSAANIIPNNVEMLGTVRTFNPKVREILPEKIERVIAGTCETFRTTYEYEFIRGTPATINEPGSSARAERAVRDILGEEGLVRYEKPPGGEDFAWLLEKKPGCLAFVGCRNEVNDQNYALHSERFDLDEEAMVNGAALFVQYVLVTQDEI